MADDKVQNANQEQQDKTAAPSKKPAAKRKRATKKSASIIMVRSKRKRAIARASVRAGSGIIRVNRESIEIIEPVELRRLMVEPIEVSSATSSAFKGIDIDVKVRGGGSVSQAQAVRGVIAKGIVKFSGSDAIRDDYLRYDRFMIVDDPRRVEPKKFLGTKARARFQKSYR
jgi:small subunit ribosomal protein S9